MAAAAASAFDARVIDAFIRVDEMHIADGDKIRARAFPNSHVLAPELGLCERALGMPRSTGIGDEEPIPALARAELLGLLALDMHLHGVAQHGTRMSFAATGRDAVEVCVRRGRFEEFSLWLWFDHDTTTLGDLYARVRSDDCERAPLMRGNDYVWKMDGRTFARFADGESTPEMERTLADHGVRCGARLTVTCIAHVRMDVLAPELGLRERIDTPMDATLGAIKERAGVGVPCVVSLFNGRFVRDDDITAQEIVGRHGVPRPFPLHVHKVPVDGRFVILRRQHAPLMCAVVPYTLATTVAELCEKAARMSGCDAHNVHFSHSEGVGMFFGELNALRSAALSGDDERARTLVNVGVCAGAEIVFV